MSRIVRRSAAYEHPPPTWPCRPTDRPSGSRTSSSGNAAIHRHQQPQTPFLRSWLSIPSPNGTDVGRSLVGSRGRGCGPPRGHKSCQPASEPAAVAAYAPSSHMQFMPRSPGSPRNGRLCTTERIEITVLADVIAVPRRSMTSGGVNWIASISERAITEWHRLGAADIEPDLFEACQTGISTGTVAHPVCAGSRALRIASSDPLPCKCEWCKQPCVQAPGASVR